MSWLDLLIVYFACGMPFAVYRFALSESGATATALRSAEAALLWPYDGGKAAIKRLRAASRSLSKPRVDTIRSQMERILSDDLPQFAPFEFREIFDRYAGLASALNSPISPRADSLSDAADAHSAAIRRACLSRTERAKLERHLASARSDLIESLVIASSRGSLEMAASLAIELSDELLRAQVSRRLYESQGLTPAHITRLSGSTS